MAARRYDEQGAPRGDEFVVNSYTTGDQGALAVASDPDGNVLVVWEGGGRFRGQRYDLLGVPEAGEFVVPLDTTTLPHAAGAAALGNREFVLVWTARDGGHVGIFGRRFAPDVIFRDGF